MSATVNVAGDVVTRIRCCSRERLIYSVTSIYDGDLARQPRGAMNLEFTPNSRLLPIPNR